VENVCGFALHLTWTFALAIRASLLLISRLPVKANLIYTQIAGEGYSFSKRVIAPLQNISGSKPFSGRCTTPAWSSTL